MPIFCTCVILCGLCKCMYRFTLLVHAFASGGQLDGSIVLLITFKINTWMCRYVLNVLVETTWRNRYSCASLSACGSIRRHTGKHGSSAPHRRIAQPTSWPHVASPTWSSREQVARPATKRFHPSHWRPLEACCRPWTWWSNDATSLDHDDDDDDVSEYVSLYASVSACRWRES